MRVLPARIYLQRDGKNIKGADGVEQSVFHGEFKGNPMTSLKKSEYIEGASFACTVYFVNETVKKNLQPIVSKEEFEALLGVIQLTGIGARRALGNGMATITLDGQK